MMCWFMSRCHNKHISNNVIFAFKMSLLSERRLHKPYFIFMTYVVVIKVSCQSPSSKVLPTFLKYVKF